MYLTDEIEHKKIKEISDSIAGENNVSDMSNPYNHVLETEESFFSIRNENQNCVEKILRVYDVENADDIRRELNVLWDGNGRQEFILPIMAGMIKHKERTQSEGKVSPFIYEF